MNFSKYLKTGVIILSGFLGLLLAPLHASEEEIGIELEKLVLNLEHQLTDQEIKSPVKVVILGMTYEDGGMKCTSDFSTYLTDQLENLLSSKSGFKIICRDEVQKAIEAYNWQSENITPVLPENIGHHQTRSKHPC